jgi:hypothetical protein
MLNTVRERRRETKKKFSIFNRRAAATFQASTLTYEIKEKENEIFNNHS